MLGSGVSSAIRSLKRAVLDAVFGRESRCVMCSDAADSSKLCDECLSRIPMACGCRCSKCGTVIRTQSLPENDVVCKGCASTHHYFASARSPAVYEGVARSMVADLKYRARIEFAEAMANLMALECFKTGIAYECDLAVAVPMHPVKEGYRGYNQANLLCGELARLLGMECGLSVLMRREQVDTQTHHDRAGRRENTLRAFVCWEPERVRNRKVLLVDDVLTSGATADGCARALLRAGAAAVHVVTFAVSVADGRDWRGDTVCECAWLVI